MIPVALTIAGSDPSGGAGVQADLKTFTALKVYGMSVIAALTVQNTTGVSGIMDLPADVVSQQLDAVLTDIPPGAVKTGMLSSPAILEVVVRKVREYGISNLVVDPVMVSTSGSNLLSLEGIDDLRRHLLPLALVVTPNLAEAGVLTGMNVAGLDDMEEAALQIHGLGPKYVYIKGGHLPGEPVDVLFDGTDFSHIHGERIQTRDTHGTGCVLSAAITAYLARGVPVLEAAQRSRIFVNNAIQNGLRLGRGHGPCDPAGIQEE